LNPALFINQVFQMAALNHFSLLLDTEHKVPFVDAAVEEDFAQEGVDAYHRADKAGEKPAVCRHPDHGWFVTHDFDNDSEDGMRMFCWAEIGPKESNAVACDWWKAKGADPGQGMADLHRQEPPAEPEPEPEKPTREVAIEFIKNMAGLNPEGDRHGSIDPVFRQACEDYDPDYQTDTPLTLDEWRKLTRESEGYDAPFARDIKDATDPFVFLAVLRDRMVFASGCTDMVIRLIGIVVDPHIQSRTMTWR
jgi:hypothetical protein